MKLFGFVIFFALGMFNSNAQIVSRTDVESTKEVEEGWSHSASIGLDFSSILLINPKTGSGKNQINLGGVVSISSKYRRGRVFWDNYGSIIFMAQKSGNGKLSSNQRIPFVKIVDELRINSKYGRSIKEASSFYYAFDLLFISQIAPSYGAQNYISKVDIPGEVNGLLSKIFSPATMFISPSIEYKMKTDLSFLFSPISSKIIIVADDEIASIVGNKDAQRGIHGNPWRSVNDFDNIDYQLGTLLKIIYKTTIFQEKSFYRMELSAYSNYLFQPSNIDLEWRNELSYELWKGLNIVYNFNMSYDHDLPVFVTDNSFPNGIKADANGDPITARRVSTLMQFYLQYVYAF